MARITIEYYPFVQNTEIDFDGAFSGCVSFCVYNRGNFGILQDGVLMIEGGQYGPAFKSGENDFFKGRVKLDFAPPPLIKPTYRNPDGLVIWLKKHN